MNPNSDTTHAEPCPLAHDAWFRSQIQQAISEANSPNAIWHEHEAMFDALEIVVQ